MENEREDQQQQVPESKFLEDPAAERRLLLGYGNLDRQDDGVAWHILRTVSRRLRTALPERPEEYLYQISPHITVGFALHLIPEHAELISQFERVLFIDAHTGNIPQAVSFSRLTPRYEPSPFTHHLTPSTCLVLCETLYHRAPQAALLSIRGYRFNFSQSLSPDTYLLIEPAVQRVMLWLNEK
ncbi:MAG: hypothetical protein AB1522_06270 [Chloroflexota bacterium]